MCSTTTCLPVNSTSIQLRLPLDFNICINPDSKSIVNTVCAACEEAGLFRYIHNPNRDMYGYSSQKMLECVLLAYTLFGYASVRQLEDYCKHDIRFIYLMQGDQPSFMSFQRFISDDLTESIEDANSGGADAEQRHFWNRCDGVHDGSKSAPISIPFFQLI